MLLFPSMSPNAYNCVDDGMNAAGVDVVVVNVVVGSGEEVDNDDNDEVDESEGNTKTTSSSELDEVEELEVFAVAFAFVCRARFDFFEALTSSLYILSEGKLL